MEERKYIRTENEIYDGEKYDADYYLDKALNKIIKESDNLLDLIDEFRYTAYTPLFKVELPHCRCCYYKDNDTYKEGTFVTDYLTKRELNEFELATVKGYIWIEDNLICVAEMKENNGKYELVLKK